ncbi:MAG: hypothetical protein KME16_11935 [Scytolyngbya sp. HA4215-MV1]|jgi:hypothetical protein|nr:hypothetical protein [Scytolyngbya sp. HA4215-MV1]
MSQSVSERTVDFPRVANPPVNQVLFGICCVSVAINGFLLTENRGEIPAAIAHSTATEPDFVHAQQHLATSTKLTSPAANLTPETHDLVEFSPSQSLVDNLALLSPMPQPTQLREAPFSNTFDLNSVSQNRSTFSTTEIPESTAKPWFRSGTQGTKSLYIAVYQKNGSVPDRDTQLASDRAEIAQASDNRSIARLRAVRDTPFPPTGTATQPATPKFSPVKPSEAQQDSAGVSYKLVGALELGDRSAALFELNGVTQRYRLGESIGSSGWILAEIAQGQIVLRRNREVRSLALGEQIR